MPQLIFYVESGYPEIFNLLTRKTSIGRKEDNDIHLNDSRVSNYHAELVRIEAGSYQLVDLDSDNGTAVNGKLVEDTILNNGDQIKIGPVNATYVDQSESDEDKLLRKTIEKDLASRSKQLAHIEETIEARSQVLNAIPDSESKLAGLESVILQLERQIGSESHSLKSVQSDLEDSRQKQANLQAELDSQELELEGLEKERAELQQEYRRVLSAYENSVRLKEELDLELGNLRKEIAKEKAALAESSLAVEEAKSVIDEANILRAKMSEFDAGLKSREIAYAEIGEKIAEREAAFESLGEEVEERKLELEQLFRTLEARQKNAEDLSQVIVQNNDQIKASSQMLESMESTLKKEIDELSRSEEIQISLSKESQALSRLIKGKTAILHRLSQKFTASKNGSEKVGGVLPLRVINPQMRSLVQYFHQGAGIPDQDRVNPIGYHGLAACTRGSMHREAETIPSGNDPVLVLLDGDLEKTRDLIDSISREMPGRILLACWRTGQLDALNASLAGELDYQKLTELLGGVDGIVSVDSRTAEIIEDFKISLPHLYLPLPSPVELLDWNVPVSNAKRPRGVFVSINDYDPESKLDRARLDLLNHLVAENRITVTLYHPEPDSDFFKKLVIDNKLITSLTTPLKYSECLEILREHQFVTGFGKNLNGGYVMGDAILSRSVFLGTDYNSVIDQLLFPDFCIKDEDIQPVLRNATRLLSDQAAYIKTVEQAQSLAVELFSFETVSGRLGEFVDSLTTRPEPEDDQMQLLVEAPLVAQES
ncbi:MAG: FHA domain-containing protein [Verrucomicrobiales bacterium]|nr:FHA domain-containing protein [Verrucomicrobiales bacterium]